MKIVVAYKWAPNPQEAVVGPDGSVDWGRAKPGISEYDPVAIEVGRRLADVTGAELIGVTVGGADAGSPLARKGALSRGLDRLLVQADDSFAGLPTTHTAELLAAMIAEIGDVGLVLTGDASVDGGAKLVPAVLAGRLGWPCLLDVGSVTPSPDGLLVERAWEGGSQTVLISGPAVLGCSSDAALPRIPGMKDILAAGKKPSTDCTIQPLATASTRVLSQRRPELKARRGHIIQGGDAAAAAAELAEALRSAGVA